MNLNDKNYDRSQDLFFFFYMIRILKELHPRKIKIEPENGGFPIGISS